MLSRPEDGWTYFQPGKENRYRLSYLTDVAVDWLTQAIHGLETMDVFSVHGFSEPGRMVCTVSYWSCYVIFEDDGPAPACEEITHLHINMIEFCKKLCSDEARDALKSIMSRYANQIRNEIPYHLQRWKDTISHSYTDKIWKRNVKSMEKWADKRPEAFLSYLEQINEYFK